MDYTTDEFDDEWHGDLFLAKRGAVGKESSEAKGQGAWVGMSGTELGILRC